MIMLFTHCLYCIEKEYQYLYTLSYKRSVIAELYYTYELYNNMYYISRIPNMFFSSREKDLLFLLARLPSKTLRHQPCSVPWK